jgi:integrase
MQTADSTRRVRERGTGTLIPPRPGITQFWYGQVNDRRLNKDVRRSLKVTGTCKLDESERTPQALRNPANWTNKMMAEAALTKLLAEVGSGAVTISASNGMRYADLRKLYLDDYRENKRKSLRFDANGDATTDGLSHLDAFFGFNDSNPGTKVSNIDTPMVKKLKADLQKEGLANGTINRVTAALSKMFELAKREGKLETVPYFGKLVEPKQPRAGFLDADAYDTLYAAFGAVVKNQATGRQSTPYAYIQPFLQIGYYTGMRLGEILKLQWFHIRTADKMIDVVDTKNSENREVPMIDGLPDLFDSLWDQNPDAKNNDLIFADVKSFIKGWRKTCIAAGI